MVSDNSKNVHRAIAALLDDQDGFVRALVADGWSEAMAIRGLKLHKKTWDVARAEEVVEAEKRGAAKSSVCHIWPALPGAGVSPWIYAGLLGVPKQFIKPSSHGQHFAQYFVHKAGELTDTSLVGNEWPAVAEHVVVSGSDETVAAVRTATHATVTGYGHRVSLAVLDAPKISPDVTARLATDIVMWRQTGCFSVRAILIVGGNGRNFCEQLAREIAAEEQRLDVSFSEDEWAVRAQLRASSEFVRPVFGDGFGWAELRADPITGEQVFIDSVSVHVVADAADVLDAIQIPRENRQAVAFVGSDELAHAVLDSGFTRIAEPGEMQAPPIEWPHDGRSNTADFLRR